MRESNVKVYAEVRKPFSTQALMGMGFVRDGSQMVKRGARRLEKAIAYSRDGDIWRVTPLVRHWK
ncbi:hypothetical protein R70006_06326 [Paraburkholderia domus]|nr:hypothetical protein R70006_06326 [Paraburkholderia domus]